MGQRDLVIDGHFERQAAGPIVLAPAQSVEAMLDRRQQIMNLLRRVMVKEIDYGQIPGTLRPTLYKPGAEKLAQFFGLRTIVEPVEVTEKWSDGSSEAFFYYKYRCSIYYGDILVTQYDGIAHSHEDKYRWRWVPDVDVPFYLDKDTLVTKAGKATEFKFSVDKAESSGKYGKPPSYWALFHDAIAKGTAKPIKKKTANGKEMAAWEIDTTVFRIPNPSVEDLAHTISAIAQKRAMVGGVRIATNATDIFMVSDFVGEEEITEEDLRRTGSPHLDTRVFATGDGEGKPRMEDIAGPITKDEAENALRKAFGTATDEAKEIPPAQEEFNEMCARLENLKIDAAKFAKYIFGKAIGGLSLAHVEAIMGASDEMLQKAAK